MARQAREACRNVHLDICYSSPLLRARETAEILLSGRSVPIITDERLMEMSFGEYEGMTHYFSDPHFPLAALFRRPEEYTASVGGAETFAGLFERTGSFLREVIDPLMQSGRDVLIVGHGAMNQSIICQLKHLPIKDFWAGDFSNCRLIRLI